MAAQFIIPQLKKYVSLVETLTIVITVLQVMLITVELVHILMFFYQIRLVQTIAMIFIMLMKIEFANDVPIQMHRNVQRIKFYYVNQELIYSKIKNVLMNALIAIFQMKSC